MSFYYAQIESRISYGICFWGSGTMLNEVFILQKRIIRCLAKIDNRTSCKEYFSSLNILTVYGLYALQILELIHVNISDFDFNGDFHTYPTRSRNKLSIPLHHFATVGKTHQVFGLKMYNSLSGNVRAVRGISKFRSLIKRVLLKICPYSINEAIEGIETYFKLQN